MVFLQRADDLVVLDFRAARQKTFRNDTVTSTSPVPSSTCGGVRRIGDLLLPRAHLEWLDERTDQSATVGVQEQNPATSLWIGGDGTWKDLEGHLELGYVSQRSYAAQAGMPPRVLFWDIPALTTIDAAVHCRCSTTSPSGSRCAASCIRRTRTSSRCPLQRPPTGRSSSAWS